MLIPSVMEGEVMASSRIVINNQSSLLSEAFALKKNKKLR